MRSTRFGLMFCLILLAVPVSGQQTSSSATQSQQGTSPTPAAQDPQAVNVVNQAIIAAGGAQALLTVTDYTAAGNITYHSADNDIQGSVKILGSGFSNLRIDASLPSGVLSESFSKGKVMTGLNGTGRQILAQSPMNPARFVLPFLQLRPLVNSPYYQLIYKGLVEINGHSAHDIQILRLLGGNTNPPELLREYNTIEFFIDSTTFQVVMMQDFLFSHGPYYSVRQIQYSDYSAVSGVLVPFTINELLDSHPNRLIQLNTIVFNSGLQESVFVIADSAPKN